MKTKSTFMTNPNTPLHNGSTTCEVTESVPGMKPVFALLMRLLCAPAVVLPAFAASAGVVFSTPHSFQQVFTNGANRCAALVQGSDDSFSCSTCLGCVSGAGSFFRLAVAPMVPLFQVVALENRTRDLTRTTEAGGVYQPQFSSDLSSTNLANLGRPLTAVGTTLNTTDSVTNGSQRF